MSGRYRQRSPPWFGCSVLAGDFFRFALFIWLPSRLVLKKAVFRGVIVECTCELRPLVVRQFEKKSVPAIA